MLINRIVWSRRLSAKEKVLRNQILILRAENSTHKIRLKEFTKGPVRRCLLDRINGNNVLIRALRHELEQFNVKNRRKNNA